MKNINGKIKEAEDEREVISFCVPDFSQIKTLGDVIQILKDMELIYVSKEPRNRLWKAEEREISK